jgi:hypothetical protein
MTTHTSSHLQALHAVIRERQFHEALPSRLPEDLLLSLTSDLRSLERMDGREDSLQSAMSAPLCLAIHLLTGLVGQRTGNGMAIELSSDAVEHSLNILQYALEREVVARAIGMHGEQHDEELLGAFDQLIESVYGETAKPTPH